MAQGDVCELITFGRKNDDHLNHLIFETLRGQIGLEMCIVFTKSNEHLSQIYKPPSTQKHCLQAKASLSLNHASGLFSASGRITKMP